MRTYALPSYSFVSFRSLIGDILAIAFVSLMPAVAHLTGIPVYFIEPMRLMLIATILLSNSNNAYLLSVVLPLVSFIVSGHPEPLKMAVIIAELLLNTWLFFRLMKVTSRPFISMFSAIVLSKLFCYAAYLFVFSWSFVLAESGSVFLATQLVMTLVMSILTMLSYNRYSKEST